MESVSKDLERMHTGNQMKTLTGLVKWTTALLQTMWNDAPRESHSVGIAKALVLGRLSTGT